MTHFHSAGVVVEWLRWLCNLELMVCVISVWVSKQTLVLEQTSLLYQYEYIYICTCHLQFIEVCCLNKTAQSPDLQTR